MQMPVK